MGDTLHSKSISLVRGDIKVELDLSRFDGNFEKAQYWLDSQIMTDMVPLMPHRDGVFINRTRTISATIAGSGEVVAAAPPYGRYLYYGKVMVDAQTGRPAFYIEDVGWRHHKGAKLVATNRPLQYSNPSAVPEWFEAAKKTHVTEWVKGAQERVEGKK